MKSLASKLLQKSIRPFTSLRERPIYELEDRLIAAVKGPGRLIVQALTGSGKSTQMPLMLLNRGRLGAGGIVVLPSRA